MTNTELVSMVSLRNDALKQAYNLLLNASLLDNIIIMDNDASSKLWENDHDLLVSSIKELSTILRYYQ